jgi:hypothetical protein
MPKILPGWYVIEQFFPDGSSKFGVSQFTQTPSPPANQTVYGTWPTRAAAERAINDGSFRNAPHVWRGPNVSGSGGHGGPGGINVPGVQAPGIPSPFSWLGVLSHWVGDFVLHILDVHMWISMGWLTLGLLLIIVGILFWLKLPQKAAKAASGAVTARVNTVAGMAA